MLRNGSGLLTVPGLSAPTTGPSGLTSWLVVRQPMAPPAPAEVESIECFFASLAKLALRPAMAVRRLAASAFDRTSMTERQTCSERDGCAAANFASPAGERDAFSAEPARTSSATW